MKGASRLYGRSERLLIHIIQVDLNSRDVRAQIASPIVCGFDLDKIGTFRDAVDRLDIEIGVTVKICLEVKASACESDDVATRINRESSSEGIHERICQGLSWICIDIRVCRLNRGDNLIRRQVLREPEEASHLDNRGSRLFIHVGQVDDDLERVRCQRVRWVVVLGLNVELIIAHATGRALQIGIRRRTGFVIEKAARTESDQPIAWPDNEATAKVVHQLIRKNLALSITVVRIRGGDLRHIIPRPVVLSNLSNRIH